MASAQLFCTACNEMQSFDIQIDQNGDYLATCPVCGQILKFAGQGDLSEMIALHNTHNGPVIQVNDDGSIKPSDEQQAQLDMLSEQGDLIE